MTADEDALTWDYIPPPPPEPGKFVVRSRRRHREFTLHLSPAEAEELRDHLTAMLESWANGTMEAGSGYVVPR